MELIANTLESATWLRAPWHWSVAGVAIALTLFFLTWLGRSLSISSTFEGACSLAGAGRITDFFKRDWREDMWRYSFMIGIILGGFIATNFLSSPEPVAISQETIASLEGYGYSYPEMDETGAGFVPTQLINFQNPVGFLMILVGGFLVGFGARYAGGCTSGHAITGLSHLQLPSLITVIGFFIGGLIMANFILPHLLAL